MVQRWPSVSQAPWWSWLSFSAVGAITGWHVSASITEQPPQQHQQPSSPDQVQLSPERYREFLLLQVWANNMCQHRRWNNCPTEECFRNITGRQCNLQESPMQRFQGLRDSDPPAWQTLRRSCCRTEPPRNAPRPSRGAHFGVGRSSRQPPRTIAPPLSRRPRPIGSPPAPTPPPERQQTPAPTPPPVTPPPTLTPPALRRLRIPRRVHPPGFGNLVVTVDPSGHRTVLSPPEDR